MRRTSIIIVLTLSLGLLNFKIFAWAVTQAKPRYISLAPSTTEILFALGLDDEIVGVSSFCNYPPKARTKEKTGTFSQTNTEKILSLKPDYIFCTGLEQSEAVGRLRGLGLNVFISDPASIDELLSSINNIGKIVGRERQAQELVRKIRCVAGEVSASIKSIPLNQRPKVFIEIWHDPLTTAGRGSFIDELLTIAGGINIADDTLRPYSIFSPEEVIKRNPDCIIFAYMDRGNAGRIAGARLGWAGISAVKNNRLYNDIDPDLLLRPGPRVTDGLKEIHKRLYP
jgi:iron complex transport system substrate-binding protein